jgi:hypothetical protein
MIRMLLLRVLPRRLLPLLTLVEVLLLVRRLLAGRRTASPTDGRPPAPRTISASTRTISASSGPRYGG